MPVFIHTIDITFKIFLVLSSTSSVVLNHCASDLDSLFSEGVTDVFQIYAALFVI